MGMTMLNIYCMKFFEILYYYFLCVWVFASLCLCTTYGSQKMVLDPPELELQIVISYPMCAGY